MAKTQSVTTQRSAIDPTVLAIGLRFQEQVLDVVKGIALEREEFIDLAGTTLVAEQNLFVEGRPGTAKSLVIGSIFTRIEDATVRYFNVNKGSSPEALVGPPSLKAMLEEDKFKFNTEGMFPDADYVYVTEIFKGNAMTLNTLLQILNERVFMNGGEVVPCKLKSCFADSNEYPNTLELSALWDRFLVRYHVEPIKTAENRKRMMQANLLNGHGFGQQIPGGITRAELETLQNARHYITVNDEVYQVLLQIFQELEQMGIHIGDRRFAQSLHLASARALLNGRDHVTVDDLEVYAHTCWDQIDSATDVRKMIIRLINPHLVEIEDLVDGVDDGFETFLKELSAAQANADNQRATNVATRFLNTIEPAQRRVQTLVDEMTEQTRDTRTATRSLNHIRDLRKTAIDRMYGTPGN